MTILVGSFLNRCVMAYRTLLFLDWFRALPYILKLDRLSIVNSIAACRVAVVGRVVVILVNTVLLASSLASLL